MWILRGCLGSVIGLVIGAFIGTIVGEFLPFTTWFGDELGVAICGPVGLLAGAGLALLTARRVQKQEPNSKEEANTSSQEGVWPPPPTKPL